MRERAGQPTSGGTSNGADADVPLTPEHVVVQLADAPEGSPAERWNWWVGALEFAYGGYAEFQVRRWRD